MRSRAQLEKEEALKQLKEHLLKVGFANSTNNYNFEYFVTTIGSWPRGELLETTVFEGDYWIFRGDY